MGVQCCRWTFRIRGDRTRDDAPRFGEAHREFQISSEEFDEVAAELGRTLDFVGVPQKEKDEVLAAFAAYKSEVTEGSAARSGV